MLTKGRTDEGTVEEIQGYAYRKDESVFSATRFSLDTSFLFPLQLSRDKFELFNINLIPLFYFVNPLVFSIFFSILLFFSISLSLYFSFFERNNQTELTLCRGCRRTKSLESRSHTQFLPVFLHSFNKLQGALKENASENRREDEI